MANEKLLIDANATLAGIEAFMQCYAEKEKELTPFWVKVATQALDMVRQFIKEMPTVDAVEVVRCKDCKFCKTFYPAKEIDKEPIQVWFCKAFRFTCKQDGFCSYGERREGE